MRRLRKEVEAPHRAQGILTLKARYVSRQGRRIAAHVDDALGGDVTKVAGYQVRFAGVGFPGETYLTSYWKEGNKILMHVTSKEREATIISNAAITLR